MRPSSQPGDGPPVEAGSVRAFEEGEVDAAAAEAGLIGGPNDEVIDETDDEANSEACRAVREAGGGEAEGFEEAEALLIKNASHGDEHSDFVIFRDQGKAEEVEEAEECGEADQERSSETENGW